MLKQIFTESVIILIFVGYGTVIRHREQFSLDESVMVSGKK